MADTTDFIIKQNPYKDRLLLCAYLGKESVVKVPDGVTKICSFAFADQDKPNETITQIILPDSVEELEKNAFVYCTALKEIRWPENEELSMGGDIFKGCTSLEKISIPKNVRELGSFKMPENLKTVEVHDDLILLGQGYSCFTYESDDAIKTCYDSQTIRILTQNPTYQLIDGFMVNTKHKTALFYAARNQKCVRIPDGIEIIATCCFDEAGYLSLSKEEIEKTDFKKFDSELRDMAEREICGANCVHLEKLIIPKSVKEIKSFAFWNCSDLASIIYEGKTADLKYDDDSFNFCDELENQDPKIICSDTEKIQKAKCKKISDELSRILLIDQKIRSGCYPSAEKLAAEFGVGIATIHRDLDKILFFSHTDCPTRKELIKFDHHEKGYYYTKAFKLDIEATLLNL